MPPVIETKPAVSPFLIDIEGIDFNAVSVDAEGIEKHNRHRGESRQIDHIVWHADDLSKAIAHRKVRDNEWWVEGHIPGNPIMPAVMMVEAAAQLASFMYQARELTNYRFVGFTRIENTKFRNKVVPGDTLYLLAREVKFQLKRFICEVQGISNGNIVFETRITGMPVVK